jgi:hypothetical protein
MAVKANICTTFTAVKTVNSVKISANVFSGYLVFYNFANSPLNKNSSSNAFDEKFFKEHKSE